MKTKIKLTDQYIAHLPDEIQEDIAKATEEIDDPVVKRATTVAPIMLDAGQEQHRQALLYMSTRDMDRDNEVIIPGGMDLSQYQKAPILLFGHQWSQPPIGSMTGVHQDGYGLRGVANFADTPRAQEIWSLVRDRHLRTSSIGFIPTQWVRRGDKGFDGLLNLAMGWPEFSPEHAEQVETFITRGVLLENSIVPVPANPGALVQAIRGKEFDPELIRLCGIDLMEEIDQATQELEEQNEIIIIPDPMDVQEDQGAVSNEEAEQIGDVEAEETGEDEAEAREDAGASEEVEEIANIDIEDPKEDDIPPSGIKEDEEEETEPVIKTVYRVVSRPTPQKKRVPTAEEISLAVKEQLEIARGRI